MAKSRAPGVFAWMWAQWRAFMLAVRRVVMLQDSPERIARGCAAGMFCTFLPTFGQTFLGLLVAVCIRGSPLASLPWTWITNPFTTLPIFYGTYRLGAALTPGHATITWHRLEELLAQLQALPLFEALGRSMAVLGGVFLPLVIGGLLTGLVAAVVTWWLVRRLVVAVQARRQARMEAWRLRLAPALAEPGPTRP